MSGHTKGPWIILRAGNGYPYQIHAPNGDHVKDVTRWASISVPSLPEGEANARLIAAAPDLLEAAKKGLEVAESWIHDQLDGTSLLDSALEELEPVRAVIQSAEEGS